MASPGEAAVDETHVGKKKKVNIDKSFLEAYRRSRLKLLVTVAEERSFITNKQ